MENPNSSWPKTIAYLRVSTLDQDREKNTADILHFANHHDFRKVNFVEDVTSDRTLWWARRIAGILAEAKAGNALIVAELSRLGRSMLECTEIPALATRQGQRIYAVKGNWQTDQYLPSKIIALAFSMAAEIERDPISQRTKKTFRFKKAKGLPPGQPRGPGKSKLDPFRPEIESLLANGSAQKFMARRYHTTEANLHHWLKKRGLEALEASSTEQEP